MRNLAIKTAKNSKHHRFKLGAVLVARVGLLAAKANLAAQGTHGICAEQRVLRTAPRGTGNQGELFVARVHRDNETISMARPCPECMAIIKNKGINKIHYTNWDGEWVTESV